MMPDERMLTAEEWAMLEPWLAPNSGVVDLLDEKDRELAKAILKHKGHLGPLGMVEVGIVLGRMLPQDEPAAPPPPVTRGMGVPLRDDRDTVVCWANGCKGLFTAAYPEARAFTVPFEQCKCAVALKAEKERK